MAEPFLSESSNIIALGSLMVSILAVVYARRSVQQAHKANKINLHVHQKDLFVGFMNLCAHLREQDRFAKWEEIEKFNPLARSAPLYIRESLANQIEEYFGACCVIAGRRMEIEMENEYVREYYKANPQKTLVPKNAFGDRQKLIQEQRKNLEIIDKLGPLIEAELMKELKLV